MINDTCDILHLNESVKLCIIEKVPDTNKDADDINKDADDTNKDADDTKKDADDTNKAIKNKILHFCFP